jgi:hypothetical protein
MDRFVAGGHALLRPGSALAPGINLNYAQALEKLDCFSLAAFGPNNLYLCH